MQVIIAVPNLALIICNALILGNLHEYRNK